MKIIALDPATKCGWATDSGSGVSDFKIKPYESVGMKFIKFKALLKALFSAEDPELVVYEKPSWGHFTATRSHANFEGVLVGFCEEKGIDYKAYSPKEIKLFATGKGNSNKAKMISSAEKRWPSTEIIDDNHADALFLLELAKRDYG